MPKFGVVLNSLAGKAGIKSDDENLKKLLAFSEVSQTDLPDEFANALERNLLTTESATANPDVRSKIIAEALNGVDSRVETNLNDFEFDDTFKGEVKGIKNSYEKLNKVFTGLKDQLKAAKEKAKGSGNPQDKVEVEALKKQVAEAHTNMENLKRSHQIELENERTGRIEDKKDFTLRSTLAGKPLPKNGLPSEINILTAKHLITQDMAKNGLHYTFDEVGNPILKQRKDGADVDYFVDNKKVDFQGYVDGVLASNKFVQINDQSQQNNASGNNANQHSQQPQPGVLTNPALAAEATAQLAQLGIQIGQTV